MLGKIGFKVKLSKKECEQIFLQKETDTQNMDNSTEN